MKCATPVSPRLSRSSRCRRRCRSSSLRRSSAAPPTLSLPPSRPHGPCACRVGLKVYQRSERPSRHRIALGQMPIELLNSVGIRCGLSSCEEACDGYQPTVRWSARHEGMDHKEMFDGALATSSAASKPLLSVHRDTSRYSGAAPVGTIWFAFHPGLLATARRRRYWASSRLRSTSDGTWPTRGIAAERALTTEAPTGRP